MAIAETYLVKVKYAGVGTGHEGVVVNDNVNAETKHSDHKHTEHQQTEKGKQKKIWLMII